MCSIGEESAAMRVVVFLLILIGVPMMIISLPVVKYLRENVFNGTSRGSQGPHL